MVRLLAILVNAPLNTWNTRPDPTQHKRSIIMKCFIDTHAENKGSFPQQELTEEQFFEQFAALEEGLALLQIHMRGMSENAKLFGSLARQMRRSICPTTLSPR
jgi:hypothetical protein